MLILTRKKGESIKIGNDITITFLGENLKHPGNFRLGISAPDETSIVRSELIKRDEQGAK